MIIEIVLIMALAAGCFISSFSDLKFGKIDNKLIIFLLIVAMIGDAVLYGVLKKDLFASFALNVLVNILIGFLLYSTHIWAGGDCKLLIAISALMPAEFYWNYTSLDITLCFSLIITFCAGFIYLIIETIIIIMREKPQFEHKTIRFQLIRGIKNYLKLIIYLSAIHHIYYYFIHPFFNLPNPIYICLCILLSLKIVTTEIANSKLLLTAVIIFDICMTLFTGSIMVSLKWQTYVLVVIFMIIKIILAKYNYQTIEIQKLKPGMILSKSTSLWMQKSKVKGLPGISDETLKSRLKEEEIESIQRWGNSKFGMESVVIVRKIPFAIFISIGMISYLVLGVCG